jgi:hypothetical protein
MRSRSRLAAVADQVPFDKCVRYTYHRRNIVACFLCTPCEPHQMGLTWWVRLIRLSHNDKFSIIADVSDVTVNGSTLRARARGATCPELDAAVPSARGVGGHCTLAVHFDPCCRSSHWLFIDLFRGHNIFSLLWCLSAKRPA